MGRTREQEGAGGSRTERRSKKSSVRIVVNDRVQLNEAM